MATIKKAQNGAKTNTTEKKNIFGGSYVSPYTVKGTAKNMAKKIGKGIQAIGDPAVSAGHRLGNLLKGAYEVQKKGTKEAFENATKKNGGLVKAQNGYQTSPFQKAKQDKEEKKVEYKKFKSTKMKNGGSVAAGTKNPAKRVGPVDPKGAFTTVQKRTLAGAKGKASLTKDKQLGATKMAKSGAKISKKK